MEEELKRFFEPWELKILEIIEKAEENKKIITKPLSKNLLNPK